MGEMHKRITPMELAAEMQVSPERVGQLFRAFRDGKHPHFAGRFNRFAELTPIQVAVLRGEDFEVEIKEEDTEQAATFAADTVAMTPEQGRPKEVAPRGIEAGRTWLQKAVLTGLALIVVGHSCLIWYDMFWLWKVPGAIGGCVVFLFILTGMGLMSDRSEGMEANKENMLWAVTLLEALAIVVHQATFYRNAGEAFVAGLGLGYTWALAAVVCGCSIGATIFYQKVISK